MGLELSPKLTQNQTFFQGEERDVACKGFCNIVNEIVLYLALKLKTKIVSG